MPVSAQMLLPQPGQMVPLSVLFSPPLLKGIKVYANDPFRFDFILDRGVGAGLVPALDKGRPQVSPLHDESNRLIKYFLAALTVPEKDLWVNLSPYEKDRIVPEFFGQTEMGRDLLAQDYILKQVTASVIFPEGDVGKRFWTKVYAAMQDKYGTTDIPVDTFNKVWIVPEKAEVYEHGNAAYVTRAHLKVMLESDYLARVETLRATSLHKDSSGELTKNILREIPASTEDIFKTSRDSLLVKQLMQEIIIPILEKEVNEGENFAQLRQVYNSLILATWYKRKMAGAIHESPLRAYVDHQKIVGVDIADKGEKEKIWQQYVEAFRKGVFNYINDESVGGIHESPQPLIPRQYFSGGTDLAMGSVFKTTDLAALPNDDSRLSVVQVGLDAVSVLRDAKRFKFLEDIKGPPVWNKFELKDVLSEKRRVSFDERIIVEAYSGPFAGVVLQGDPDLLSYVIQELRSNAREAAKSKNYGLDVRDEGDTLVVRVRNDKGLIDIKALKDVAIERVKAGTLKIMKANYSGLMYVARYQRGVASHLSESVRAGWEGKISFTNILAEIEDAREMTQEELGALKNEDWLGIFVLSNRLGIKESHEGLGLSTAFALSGMDLGGYELNLSSWDPVTFEVRIKKADRAMNGIENKGGIDFNPAGIDLKVKSNGYETGANCNS
ncbi:MAG: hypothetical protein V2A70_05870 [Candidatus Omnitrophota bacterium]